MTANGEAAATRATEELRQAESRLFAKLGLDVGEAWVTHAGRRVRVLVTGEGPPLLHVHGGGAFGALHAPLAAALPGRRHYLLDRPGFGLSERAEVHPDVRGKSIALLESVLDGLGLDAVDASANSFGAGIVLWHALARPGRLRSLALVGGAAMVGHAPAPVPLRLLAARGIGPLLLRLDAPSDAQVRRLFARFGHPVVDPSIRDAMLAAERMPGYGQAWWEILAAAMTLGGTRPGLELDETDLRRIEVPIALAWGTTDPMVALDVAREIVRIRPATILTVAGVGHCPWLDDPSAVARAIEPVLAPRAPSGAGARRDQNPQV